MDLELRQKFSSAFAALPHLPPQMIEEILAQIKRLDIGAEKLDCLVETFSRAHEAPDGLPEQNGQDRKHKFTSRDMLDIMSEWGIKRQEDIGLDLGIDGYPQGEISDFGRRKLGLPFLNEKRHDWKNPETVLLFVLDYYNESLSLAEKIEKWNISFDYYAEKVTTLGLPSIKSRPSNQQRQWAKDALADIEKMKEKEERSFAVIAAHLSKKFDTKITRNMVIRAHDSYIKPKYPAKYSKHPPSSEEDLTVL